MSAGPAGAAVGERAGALRQQARQTEVGDADGAVGAHQHVLRLQVAVHVPGARA